MEQGKYILLETDVQHREKQWQNQRTKQASDRMKKEKSLLKNAEKLHKASQRWVLEGLELPQFLRYDKWPITEPKACDFCTYRQREQSLLDQQAKQQQAVVEAERSHKKHEKFLQDTINK